jgi:hypothetical protein
MLAYLKETQPPEKAAEFEAFLKRFHEDIGPRLWHEMRPYAFSGNLSSLLILTVSELD